MKDRIPVILGPTGVGKTQASLKLADILNGEIVSFDSRQIYKFMDIGTAKPTEEERERIPHHLIDVVSPEESFTAADFSIKAREAIREIAGRNKQAIAAGGSGLYLKALIEGFFQGPRPDKKIRERLQGEAQKVGEPHLFSRLGKVDPEAAKRIHPHDLVRIIRALEVYEATGKPISLWQREGDYQPFPMKFVKIGLNLPRERLYLRIDSRVEEMMAQGLLEEVKRLRKKGFSPKSKALKTVGYQELFAYLDGKTDIVTATEEIKQNTRQYAKRQLTWFRKDKEITWLDADAEDLIEKILGYIL